MKFHYLSSEEEKAIKEAIPWNNLDRLIREVVRLANRVEGIATVQSCEGHVRPNDEGFTIDPAHITLKATEERTQEILFDIVPGLEFVNVSLRHWGDGRFWLSIEVDPSERWKLYRLVEQLGGKGHVKPN